MAQTKICTGCGKEFPATLEYFYAKGNSISSRCKKCQNEDCYRYKIARGRKERVFLPDLPGELWVPIIGYVGWYDVSNFGRVKRVMGGAGTFSGKILSDQNMGDGYAGVTLWKNGSHCRFYVHHLVMSAFIGPRLEGLQVNHKDGNKKNNSLDNLEYVTPVENMAHASGTGLVSQRGENSSRSKLVEKEVHEIRKLLGKETHKSIAAMYNVGVAAISRIATGKSWGSLKEEEADNVEQ